MIYQYDNTANSNKGIGHLTRIVDGAALTDYTYDLQNTPRAILGASNGARPPVSKRLVACADSKKKSRALLRFHKLPSCSQIELNQRP